MATLAQSVPAPPRTSAWFWEFLKEELAPYPGRAGTVTRMVLAATLVMIICMTFRIPYQFQGALYALIISRDNRRATLKSATTIFLFTDIGAAYLLLSAWFVISVPLFHFLWVISSFFLVFYALRAITDYGAVTAFVVLIILGVPLWDRHVSAETNVEDTLRIVLSVIVGVVVTAAVELAFARRKPGDEIVLPVAEQLAAVQSVLACYLEGRPVDQTIENKITSLGVLGTSALRRTLRHSNYSSEYTSQMSAVVALVGRLVDIAAALTQLSFEPSDNDKKQLRNLVATVASIRTDLVNRRIPASIRFNPDDPSSRGLPLLREMEQTVSLIPQVLVGSRSMDEYLPASDDTPPSKFVTPDAFANPEHFKFALKGCLAASICYIIYNSIAWRGISTAVTTCILTALSTIGSSRQKQVLRFTGAIAGGFLLGMGSQVFVLPHLDSIAGFTVLFVLVTGVAAWFMTSSPRLSYFGFQIAVAFYFINLQEFGMQRSLSVARDRVVGILLGLFMMWLVFDQLWGAPAAVEMRRAFVSNLRSLAQLAREPVSRDIRTAIKRTYALRDTINASFDKVRSLADGVLLEFGPSRQQDLALRDRIRRWQPQLRTLFLIRFTLLKYRLRLPGFDLPEAVELAQQEFDAELGKVLDGMADRLEAKASPGEVHLEQSYERLEQTVVTCRSEGPEQGLAAKLKTFLALSRSMESLATSLSKEI